MLPRELETPEYSVEVWDINNVFVADISHIIATDISFKVAINQPEDLSFSLDLVQFEKLCASIGARPVSIIEPYRTDIKIKRNDTYLFGAHVIDVQANFNSSETNKLIVKCSGYLSYFKDRYITNEYRGLTYAQISRALIEETQKSYNYIVNSRFEQGILGWGNIDGAYVQYIPGGGRDGYGGLFANITEGPNDYGGARWDRNLNLKSGVQYTLTFDARAGTPSGNFYVRSWSANPTWTSNITDTNWNTYTVTWTQGVDSNYLDIKTSGNINFWLDNVILNDNINTSVARDFGVTLGHDFASIAHQTDRVRNYDLQNVKDGIVNLTKLENDNFEFEFTADKQYNVYEKLGSLKPNIELVYPQNISSMSVRRSAQGLSNQVLGLGSGIGTERLESLQFDYNSALTYRVRESTLLYNDISIQATLDNHSSGALKESRNLYDIVTVNVSNNSINLNGVWLGDVIHVRVDGSSYVDFVNNPYRILEINVNVSKEMQESISLELERYDNGY